MKSSTGRNLEKPARQILIPQVQVRFQVGLLIIWIDFSWYVGLIWRNTDLEAWPKSVKLYPIGYKTYRKSRDQNHCNFFMS
jgi:hypothetical protein